MYNYKVQINVQISILNRQERQKTSHHIDYSLVINPIFHALIYNKTPASKGNKYKPNQLQAGAILNGSGAGHYQYN